MPEGMTRARSGDEMKSFCKPPGQKLIEVSLRGKLQRGVEADCE